MVNIEVEDNGMNGRFIIYENEVLAGDMTFLWQGNSKIVIDHTNVSKDFGGKGYGKLLVTKAAAFARQRQIKIEPECPFVKALFEKDVSFGDVKA